MIVWAINVCTATLESALPDFVYLDFNDTTGLAFVGTSATTSCDGGELVMTVSHCLTVKRVSLIHPGARLVLLVPTSPWHVGRHRQWHHSRPSGPYFAGNVRVNGRELIVYGIAPGYGHNVSVVTRTADK
jgi:hypothetical protein